MERRSNKGPEIPSIHPWIGDEPMREIRAQLNGVEGRGEPLFTNPYVPSYNNGYLQHPIPADVYPVIDTDLGRDNVQNDLPRADLNDL